MLAGIFTVSKTDFERLSALEAVEFFRALLWAEARHLKLPTHQVKVSSLINVPDGGIDASLESTDPPPSSGIFLAARTGYQIKASEAFHPQREGEIKKELFGKNKRVR